MAFFFRGYDRLFNAAPVFSRQGQRDVHVLNFCRFSFRQRNGDGVGAMLNGGAGTVKTGVLFGLSESAVVGMVEGLGDEADIGVQSYPLTFGLSFADFDETIELTSCLNCQGGN